MAAHRQGVYHEFHVAVMRSPEELSEAAVMEIAAAIGVDTERLRQDMEDPAIESYLDETARVARALDIRGTPAFVIGDTLIPGTVDAAGLAAMVEKARSGG